MKYTILLLVLLAGCSQEVPETKQVRLTSVGQLELDCDFAKTLICPEAPFVHGEYVSDNMLTYAGCLFKEEEVMTSQKANDWCNE